MKLLHFLTTLKRPQEPKQMPFRRSHKAALAAIGVIVGWISFSAVSNSTEIRLHAGRVADLCREGEGVVCRTASCEFKYYYFIPDMKSLRSKQFIFNPQMWCMKSVMDDMR